MSAPFMKEIYLHPCDLWFGSGQIRLRTVLGSCVAVTLWHPGVAIGGMCHFMVSQSPKSVTEKPDGCYADRAMALLQAKIRGAGLLPEDFEAKLFGAGNMFTEKKFTPGSLPFKVQDHNISAGRELTEKYGHRVVAEHLGGDGHRQLIFDITTGLVWLRQAQDGECFDGAEKERAS